MPADELLPPFDWITYREPEGHLDKLVDLLVTLPGLSRQARVCGLTYKEDSTLSRFGDLGFQTWRLEESADLGVEDSRAGLETIQGRICSDLVGPFTRKHGTPDVIVARHILEHAHDTRGFLETLRSIVSPSGYVVFEVPDSGGLLETLDYTGIWEEHVLYFTRETFRHTLACGGFSVFRFVEYPYPFENALVAIAKPHETKADASLSRATLEEEKRRARAFGQGFSRRREEVDRFFRRYRADGGRVALFGAGHLACMFVNAMNIRDHIEFVVDDHPKKKGLRIPGSQLPIYGSQALIEENISLCLTGLSPESEGKVRAGNRGFSEAGGRFASIFPASENALQL